MRCARAVRKVGYFGPIFPRWPRGHSDYCFPRRRTTQIPSQCKNSDNELKQTLFPPKNARLRSKSAVFAVWMVAGGWFSARARERLLTIGRRGRAVRPLSRNAPTGSPMRQCPSIRGIRGIRVSVPWRSQAPAKRVLPFWAGQSRCTVGSVCLYALIKTEYWDRAGGGGNISYDW